MNYGTKQLLILLKEVRNMSIDDYNKLYYKVNKRDVQ